MKKTLLVMTIASLMILLTACCSSDSPKAIATKFADAFVKYDIDEARKYTTTESTFILDAVKTMVTPEIQEAAKNTTIEYVAVNETSDSTAIVNFKAFKFVEINIFDEGKFKIVAEKDDLDIPMLKVDGKWLANVVKDSK